MNDYISRQDAVKALDGKIIVTGRKNADAVLQYMKDISNKIKSLPPADVIPVVRCKDCKYNATTHSFYEDGYKRGLADAWEAARKIASDNAGRNYSIFGQHFTVEILNTHSASESIEKIRQYEQKQEEKQLQVGDEVEAAFGKATVTETTEKHVYYFYADGSYGFDEKEHVTKTGRHFPEIAEVLQKMKES